MFNLQQIALLSDARTRSISAENPTGGVSAGAQSSPGDPGTTPASRVLGRGWKVRPCLRDLLPGQTVTLADIEGPGVVQHLWFTVLSEAHRSLSLRVYYDDQEHASVECPLGDFFGNGLDGLALVNSLPVAVNPRGGMNSYWPMPFRGRFRLTITNDGPSAVGELFYQVTYALGEVPEDAAYFHASWRRSVTTRERPEHTILDGVRGRGHYVGTSLVWAQLSTWWWGEGEVKFFIDGDPPDGPTICGTGTEDYFGGAWGFVMDHGRDLTPTTYSTAFLGYTQAVFGSAAKIGPRPPQHNLYRWHIPDPIRFSRDLRVTVQALGWWPQAGVYQPLADDIASVAYWYQALPSAGLASLGGMAERWPR
ncbi:MAG: DUF2961 domain-containing protein [Phycisphaeraceae bacterium]|nr:DUF2961 domain-containing protein [Phycisphaerae bacterium]MBX3393002.1 DUF2961 domain-containing protein [Phycisphaeraceae bacterium]